MVRNFYQPVAPVNWSETLAEYYAHEAKQLEEHHKNLRERDQQMVDKVKREDPIKTADKVADTTLALIEFGKAAKNLKDRKDAKKRGEVAKKIAANPATFDTISEELQN